MAVLPLPGAGGEAAHPAALRGGWRCRRRRAGGCQGRAGRNLPSRGLWELPPPGPSPWGWGGLRGRCHLRGRAGDGEGRRVPAGRSRRRCPQAAALGLRRFPLCPAVGLAFPGAGWAPTRAKAFRKAQPAASGLPPRLRQPRRQGIVLAPALPAAPARPGPG